MASSVSVAMGSCLQTSPECRHRLDSPPLRNAPSSPFLSCRKPESLASSGGFLAGSHGVNGFIKLFKGNWPAAMKPALIGGPNITARLFGPSIFEASKLKVLFLGTDEEKHPDQLPRAYTLTHSDITAKLTLAVSHTINKAQMKGWYNRLQRDEVLAEWKKSQGTMSLHVHCHISGGHWLLDAIAKLRFYIFRKELPVVLEAFRHGDQVLLSKHPELDQALVWVFFHSNVKEFNRVECWGPLENAAKGATANEQSKQAIHDAMDELMMQGRDMKRQRPVRCPNPCDCCFPPRNIIPLPDSFDDTENAQQQQA